MNTFIYFVITGLICFIVGYVIGMIVTKKTFIKNSEEHYFQNKSNPSSLNNTRNANKKEIRAVQTRGRRGASVEVRASEGIFKGVKSKKRDDKPELNFSGIGLASEAEKDDLKKINGIGPFIEQKLNKVGIYTYRQISRFTDYEIETVTQLIEFFPGRIKRDNWKQQATVLAKYSKAK